MSTLTLWTCQWLNSFTWTKRTFLLHYVGFFPHRVFRKGMKAAIEGVRGKICLWFFSVEKWLVELLMRTLFTFYLGKLPKRKDSQLWGSGWLKTQRKSSGHHPYYHTGHGSTFGLTVIYLCPSKPKTLVPPLHRCGVSSIILSIKLLESILQSSSLLYSNTFSGIEFH